MARDLFGNILDAISVSFRHLSNADPTTLLLVAAAIAVTGYFLLRSR